MTQTWEVLLVDNHHSCELTSLGWDFWYYTPSLKPLSTVSTTHYKISPFGKVSCFDQKCTKVSFGFDRGLDLSKEVEEFWPSGEFLAAQIGIGTSRPVHRCSTQRVGFPTQCSLSEHKQSALLCCRQATIGFSLSSTETTSMVTSLWLFESCFEAP